ncbi:transposase domain-containing protein [Nonomuraea sp. 3N208]
MARQVPPGLVDEVLETTGRAERRFRALPSRVVSTSCWRWPCSASGVTAA